ncbi:DUF4345 family protein [Lentisphaera profundi]|uniref:DUF4345 family protein n=1 Tax=Lentisphaera profundi TaxID=1658616 RepID=A0ABY7W204_9BACT|nr:DUF4345 family protein [Lentisphaera profundi]WDE98994.1 DUF4345 family protein [Lentisphaera profundi]
MKTKIARFSLLMIATIYLCFGIMFFVDPASFSKGLGFVNLSPEALIEIRAIYGGLEVAIGLGIIFLLKKEPITAAYISLISFIGFAGGRIIGVALAGFLGWHHYYLILEITLGLLSWWSLLQFKSRK